MSVASVAGRRLVAALGMIVAGVLAAGSTAHAQSAWPNRTIRIVVPFAPGGASDILGRLIAKELSERVKQPVIVENKPGAGGTIGADLVAKSPPDGYTLLLADVSVVMTFPSLYPNLPYAAKDLIPVANIATFGLILIAPANTRFNSLTEVIAAEKATPGKLNMASPGSGSSNHLTLERFNAAAGTKIVHIPYKGAGPAVNDVVGGQVDFTLASGSASKPLIDTGKVKALAVTSLKRNPLLPQVPTVAEAGVPDYESTLWFGLLTGAAVPRPIVEKISADVGKVLSSPVTRERWQPIGIEPRPTTPAGFDQLLAEEIRVFTDIARGANIRAE